MVNSDQSEGYSDQFKFDTVVQALRGDRPESEVAADNDISPETLSDWKDQFFESGPDVFKSQGVDGVREKTDLPLNSVIQSLPDMALTLDNSRTIRAVNSALLETLGFSEDDLIGRSLESLLASDVISYESVDELFRVLKSRPVDVTFRRQDGGEVPASLSVSDRIPDDNLLCFARDISDLREAQEKLERERNRFRAIYDQAPVGLWEQDMSDARDYALSLKEDANQDFETYLKEHPGELREIASRIKTLSVNQQLLDILKAEDRDHLLQNLNNVFTEETYEVFRDEMVKFFVENETTYRNEVNVQTVEGEPRTVLFSLNRASSANDGWSWVFVTYRDITERKRMQRELAKNEERFRQLTENINSIFWIEDLETGENLYISPAVEEITGRSRREFIRDPDAFLEMVHPDDRDRVKEAFRTARDHNFEPPGQYSEEYRIVRPDDQVRWLQDRAFPVRNDDGEVYRVAGIAEDITERKRMEQRLQESLNEKETLLQEVHHRVKNNMQIISSLLRLQSYQVEDEDVRQEFLDCQQRVRSMVMVHERLYRSEQLSDVDLEEYIQKLVADLIDSYPVDRDPDVNLHIEEELDLGLDDTIASGLVINELVSNSLEHGFDHTIQSPEIDLEFEQQDNQAHLIVRDNGIGTPEELNPQESDSLGLQLLDSLTATQLEGDYEIRRNGGTTVEIKFPLKTGDDGRDA